VSVVPAAGVDPRFLAPPSGCWRIGTWTGGGRCTRPPATPSDPLRPRWGWSSRGRGVGDVDRSTASYPIECPEGFASGVSEMRSGSSLKTQRRSAGQGLMWAQAAAPGQTLRPRAPIVSRGRGRAGRSEGAERHAFGLPAIARLSTSGLLPIV
jgi:hypothetical protein